MVSVDADAIPDELKSRDQWLLWDKSNDTPRQPHWKGNFGISWSDPDDWHSFEEAVEAAETRESWGIGYVLAADNDDEPRGLYGVIDIDGCTEQPKRKKKDWVPSLREFYERDAYAEWSPSGTGIHIPIVGAEVPDWWKDEHFSDDKHEGVEFLTNKFCTFTGDQMKGAGEEIVGQGDWLEDWLVEVHKAITGDDPTNQQSESFDSAREGGRSRSDDDLSEDEVRDALEHIDPDVGYPTWRDIGFALQDHFSSDHTALSVFADWSRGGSKWDDDAEKQAERIIEGADSGGGRTIGTVVHLAKRNGWSYPSKASATDGGKATEKPDLPEPSPPDKELDPSWVIETALNAPHARIKRTEEDKESPSVHDLRTPEAALYTWRLLEELDEDHVVAVNTGDLRAYSDGVWDKDGEQYLREKGTEALGPRYSSSVREQLEERVRAERPIHFTELGVEEGKIAVKNGLLDMDTREIRDLEPDDYATRRIPVEYDEDAEAEQWKSFIDDVVPRRWHDAVQEFVGYCLCIDQLPIHRALMLVGNGANGKSVFLDVIQELLGSDNVGNKSLQQLSNEPNARADLFGKIANIDNDLSSRSLDVGTFKKLAAGDRIHARQLYQEGFEYPATFKQLYAANQVPDIPVDEMDDAFFRRWLIVEFPEHFPKGSEQRDPHLDEKLKEELPGILNWALEGRERLLEQSYFTNETAQDTRQRWNSWGDSITSFIEDHCEGGEDGERISASEAHQLYAQWCRQEQDQAPEPQQTLTSNLKGVPGVTYKQSIRTGSSHSSGFEGLKITYQPDSNEGQQSGLDNIQDPREQIYRIVEDREDEHENGAPEGEVYEQAANLGYDEERTEDRIQTLLESGRIMEPTSGFYRTT